MRPSPVAVLERLWHLYHTPAGRRLFRYTMVSVISTGVSFAVLGIVYGVIRAWSEVPSTVFANLVATVPSYYLNRNWVWGKSGRSHLFKEVVPFWAASITGIFLSIFTAAGAQHIGQTYFPNHHGLRTLLVEAANLFAFGLLWVLKFVLFNRLFRVHPAQDLEHEAEAELRAAESVPRPAPPDTSLPVSPERVSPESS